MGQSKRELERREEREAAAAEVAARAGFLEECVCHGDGVAARPPADGEVEALVADLVRRGDPLVDSFDGDVGAAAELVRAVVAGSGPVCAICASNADPEKEVEVAPPGPDPGPDRPPTSADSPGRPSSAAVDPAEAALLVQVGRAWPVGEADTVRLVYADWLADRNRPEEYTVRHYPPEQWMIRTPDPDDHRQLRIPWLAGAASVPDGADPDRDLAAVLAANGITADPPPEVARLRAAACDRCGARLFPADPAALAHLRGDPAATRVPYFCRTCHDPGRNPALAALLAARCRVCGRPAFGGPDAANLDLGDRPAARVPDVCGPCAIRLDVLGPDLDPLAPRD